MTTNYRYLLYIFTIIVCVDAIAGHESIPLSNETSVANKTLLKKAEAGDVVAILELGKSKDQTLIPKLSQMFKDAKGKKEHPVYIRSLRTTLAQLGESEARQEIINDLDSGRRYAQYQAFEDASRVGGKEMIRKIAAKLFDTSPGGRPVEYDDKSGRNQIVSDVGLPAPRHAAVIALTRLIDDPTAPKVDLNKITYNEENVHKWREWWQANSNIYCNLNSNKVVETRAVSTNETIGIGQ